MSTQRKRVDFLFTFYEFYAPILIGYKNPLEVMADKIWQLILEKETQANWTYVFVAVKVETKLAQCTFANFFQLRALLQLADIDTQKLLFV